MTTRPAWLAVLALLVLVAAGCPRQIAPARPRAAMKSAYGPIREKTPGVAVLGEELVVGTAWFASCEDWEVRTGEWEGSRPCKSLDFDVAVTCDGPCAVAGERVTPQRLGRLTVTVTLTRPEETAVFSFPVDVLPPDGFWLEGCTNVAMRDGVIERQTQIRGDGARCILGMTSVGVGVLAEEYAVRLPILVGGHATDRLTPEVIAAGIGAPGSPIVPGTYAVELRYQDFSRILQVEISPESLAGQSR